MKDIHQVLLDHWGYSAFRPLQEDIIRHVLQGGDALALLPTGGGKSICFQVPALAMEGICIVISPLIALMKDQVENLRKRGIAAEAIYTGLSQQETEWILNAAEHGRLKFLYVSPERCVGETFRAHFQRMPVCLLAVDESHCISQWGYDFRPPYLRIAELRPYFPKVPVLALTATATADVVEDIQNKLNFREHKVFQKSFRRDNLVYTVVYDEDKMGRIERIAAKIKGTGIVYVRSRRKTADIARALIQRGISATYYHAGLDNAERSRRQKEWIDGGVRVMVATNAFGMGIDKPDVRFVVHWDLPDTLEAYFQEAGRAGRDEKRAFALMIFHPSDALEAEENFAKAYPPTDFIRRVYTAVSNYYQVPEGGGEGSVHAFHLKEFCREYNFPMPETFSAFVFLEKEGYVRLSENALEASRLHLCCSYETLYRYEVLHPEYEPLLKFIMRTYGGRLFSDFMSVYEKEMARGVNLSETEVVEQLQTLVRMGIVNYQPLIKGASLTFLRERVKTGRVCLSPENYELRKQNARRKLDAVLAYVREQTLCRNRYLIQYFNEDLRENCGMCDVCLAKKHPFLSASERNRLMEKVRPFLREPHSIRDFLAAFPEEEERDLQQLWNYLLAEELLCPAGFLMYRLK